MMFDMRLTITEIIFFLFAALGLVAFFVFDIYAVFWLIEHIKIIG